MGGVQNQKAVRSLTLNRMNRDRFFEIMAGRTAKVQLPGGNRVMMDMEDSDPVAALKVEKTGRDGLKASLMGVAPMKGSEGPRQVAGWLSRGAVSVRGVRPEDLPVQRVMHPGHGAVHGADVHGAGWKRDGGAERYSAVL